jgi:hypothetical protein
MDHEGKAKLGKTWFDLTYYLSMSRWFDTSSKSYKLLGLSANMAKATLAFSPPLTA